MSAAAAIDFTYRYPFLSSVGDIGTGFGLRLATCDAGHKHPHFFEGRMREPRVVGDMLLCLSDVVRTHFFLPRPALLDPVVTSHEEVVRFEGFSGCCGVYARVDLAAAAFEADLAGRGTTNVDFNNPMRAALSRLRNTDDARLAVGQDAVTVSRNDDAVVEKKVKLPVRWLKGFSEVQAYQPRLGLKWEVSASEARRFIRGLPRGGPPKTPSFVTQTGRALRLSQREGKGAIRLMGTHRLAIVEPLLSAAKTLRVWADNEAGTSAWEIICPTGRFLLMLSPEVYRGFSGEGQVLESLANQHWQEALPAVQAQLGWQAHVDSQALAETIGFETDDVDAALAALGTRGLAGFDVATQQFFHREMPFDLGLIESLQPRLVNARKLIDKGQVTLTKRFEDGVSKKSDKSDAASESGPSADFAVAGTGVQHQVRLRPDGDKCTCPWFSKYQGQRGPCKHILASRMALENS